MHSLNKFFVISFLLLCFLLSVEAGEVVAQEMSRPPNFVIIYTDDQGAGDLGSYGAKDLKTPFIDRLAVEGARFTNWYSNSPVCSPSRASLLTGKYPERAGIPAVLPSRATFDVPGLREGERTLARELKKLGYVTTIIGKWHLGSAEHSRPRAQGFDEFFGYFSGWIDGYSHRYYSKNSRVPHFFHDLWHNETEVQEDPEYYTDLFSRKAVEFIERQSADRPFLLYLAYGAPHYPMIAPKEYLERFPSSMDRDRRAYAAIMAGIDDGVGAVMDALRRKGFDQNTVVFYQSDNGGTEEPYADHRGRNYRGSSNAPYYGYKASLFEGGIRVPAIMVWPGHIPAGSVVEEVGAAMDILPTFLSWADPEQTVDGIDGLNVSDMIINGAESPHQALFWAHGDQLAVRRGDWKLILNPRPPSGTVMVADVWLSDLKNDPEEKKNWKNDYPDVVEKLKGDLAEWRKYIEQESDGDD